LEIAGRIQTILDKYCLASGQRINRDKSSIFFSKKCPSATKEGIKAALDIQNETLNEKYLGMPTDVGRSRSGALKYLKDWIWNKIQGWLERFLSAGGKDVLIKSVAQAIPIFSMACFRIPRGLCEHINSLLRSSGGAVAMGREKRVGFHGERCANRSNLEGWGLGTLNC
jgi:hypothetical protein